jgi:hypothetical protein
MRVLHMRIVVAFVVLTACVGCQSSARPSASSTSDGPPVPSSVAPARSNASDVIVRIRKIGGPGGKQVLNQLNVPTPLGDDFNVTEQVGATQLAFRGKVEDLRNGQYRVHYDYAETSASGRQQLKSLIEMPLDTEKQIGGVLARDGAEGETESIVLSLSRP